MRRFERDDEGFEAAVNIVKRRELTDEVLRCLTMRVLMVELVFRGDLTVTVGVDFWVVRGDDDDGARFVWWWKRICD